MRVRSPAISALLVVFTFALAGCGSGGSSGPSAPAAGTSGSPATPPPPSGTPSIQVLPASFDFGKLTSGNTSAPLQVTIRNTGTAALSLVNITLNAASGPPYTMAVGGGTKPCGSTARQVAPSEECTVQVLFQPTSPGTFGATLQISSNDSKSPTTTLPIVGLSEPVLSLSVRIGQLDTSCPSPRVTAYVSVTDQGGFPVKQLTRDNFATMQSSTMLPIVSSAFVETVSAPIAIAALMDHSSSLTSQPIALADMKSGLSSLVSVLRPGDIAEIVSFDDRVVVVQPFTPDKSQLLAAIVAPFEIRSGTSLYDSVYQAADDIGMKTSFRRAIVVTTDGVDTRSRRGLSEAIANAVNKRVPVFTIGIGSDIDRDVLRQLAVETGGQFYEANTSQNLATVYQQLSSLLYVNQYVMTFDQLSKGSANVVSDVSIRATLGSASDVSIKSVASCN